MLNSPFPSNMWNLYDYYLNENGAMYSVRKALGLSHYTYNSGNDISLYESFHIIYNYNDYSISLVTNFKFKYMDKSNIKLKGVYNIRDIHGNIVDSNSTSIDINTLGYDASYSLFKINRDNNMKLFFLQCLIINDINDEILDENVYWFGQKDDELNWNENTFYQTAVKKYTDFTELNNIGKISLNIMNTTSIVMNENGDKIYKTMVNISNPTSNQVIFMANINIMCNNELVSPIFWNDNWLTIFPNEYRIVNATYMLNDINNPQIYISVNTYNNNV